MKKHNGMRPQDVVILLKMTSYKRGDDWRLIDLANDLKISHSEISEALNRCRVAELVDADKRTVYTGAFCDFLIHGLKYVFPVELGAVVRGVATAHSAPPVSLRIAGGSELLVWQYAKGQQRGQAVEPLYRTVPEIVQNDTKLYELLAIADTLRIGRVREVEIAIEELKLRIDAQYIEMLQRVAIGLGDLNDEVVFVGGSVAELYANDPAASDIRPTLDVVCVVELSTRSAYYQLEERLR